MQVDNTTYKDLSIFNTEESFSVFHKLNFTQSNGGKEWLRYMMSEPFDTLDKIRDNQKIIQLIGSCLDNWPNTITNGTMIMLERFYESPVDPIPRSPDIVSAFLYKLLHSHDYRLTRFSVKHFSDFIKGMVKLADLITQPESPVKLQLFSSQIRALLSRRELQDLVNKKPDAIFSLKENLYFGRFLYFSFKAQFRELTEIYYQLDAWYSMAMAVRKYKLSFPEFIDSEEPIIQAEKIYHILLPEPISYDIILSPQSHFLFLTGANMSGKSTFIKSLGVSVYLAHLGMGVPAARLQLSLFDGILTNINVEDNIVKGESYFFNEVQRIKNTILTINNGRKWLVLIDELFKGTNIQDAMRCSLAVIEGLVKIQNSLFVLSTHLYEIGDEIRTYPSISFKYFETSIQNDKLHFSYQLKDGISNDRFGYFILKTEKVVDLLESL
ncbi:MAG: DNA mismatch repair protein MutS [Chitinophagaceae bacterium]|nr:DNA mismatch repair protein MutS [Chitinophagaceae bacterium]